MWVLTEVAFKGVTSGTRAGQSWPMDVYLRGNIRYKGRSVSALCLYSRRQYLVQEAVSIGLWVYTHGGNIWYKRRSVSAFGSILTGATSGTRGGQSWLFPGPVPPSGRPPAVPGESCTSPSATTCCPAY